MTNDKAKTKTFSLRIDANELDRFFVVATHNNRSANGQLLTLIRKCIDEHEAEFGEIELGKSQ